MKLPSFFPLRYFLVKPCLLILSFHLPYVAVKPFFSPPSNLFAFFFLICYIFPQVLCFSFTSPQWFLHILHYLELFNATIKSLFSVNVLVHQFNLKTLTFLLTLSGNGLLSLPAFYFPRLVSVSQHLFHWSLCILKFSLV